MWSEILVVVGAPLVRSGLGWAEKSLQDRKISLFEWKKLAQTLIRVGLIAGCELAIAKGILNIDLGSIEMLAISASSILTDKLFGALKDNNNVTRR